MQQNNTGRYGRRTGIRSRCQTTSHSESFTRNHLNSLHIYATHFTQADSDLGSDHCKNHFPAVHAGLLPLSRPLQCSQLWNCLDWRLFSSCPKPSIPHPVLPLTAKTADVALDQLAKSNFSPKILIESEVSNRRQENQYDFKPFELHCHNFGCWTSVFIVTYSQVQTVAKLTFWNSRDLTELLPDNLNQ